MDSEGAGEALLGSHGLADALWLLFRSAVEDKPIRSSPEFVLLPSGNVISSQTYGDSGMLLDWAADSGIVQVGVNDAGVSDCEFCAQLAGGVGDSRYGRLTGDIPLHHGRWEM